MAKSRKQQAIENHHRLLEGLRTEFLKRCDEVTLAVKEKLAKTGPENPEAKQNMLNEQQKLLNEILLDLNNKIAQANKELIEIMERDEKEANENQMNQLLNKL